MVQGQPLKESQWCSMCSKECSTWDVPTMTKEPLVGIVAGTCCFDHSVMNQSKSNRAGITGHTALPWTGFAYEMQCKQPDWIIDECTPDSMQLERGLAKFLGEHYSVNTWILEPCVFGQVRLASGHTALCNRMCVSRR